MKNTKYQIRDTRTKQIVGTYSTLMRAYNRADKLDSKYGAVRYCVETVLAN